MTRFTWQTLEIIFLRSSFPIQPFNAWMPFLSWTLKLFWTADKEFSSLRHTLHGSIACSGQSTVSRIVAITRYCIARMRSAASRASLARASVAFLRQSSNLFFALESTSTADSPRSAISNFLIRSATEHSSSPACVADAPCSRLDLALSSTLYSNPIPSSKKLILASKSFLDNPSNLDLISSISRTINPRNFSSVTSFSVFVNSDDGFSDFSFFVQRHFTVFLVLPVSNSKGAFI